MQEWAKRLRDEPCNRTLASELVSGLLDQAEYGTIIRFSEQTEAKCGLNEELLTAVYTAYTRTSDFVGSEKTADKLVSEYPADPNVYGWRAETREKRDDFSGAYSDMVIAFSLFLDPSDVALSVYYDLARLAAKVDQPCLAVATLRDYIAYDPENRRTQQLATLMSDWQKQGSCAPLSGTGTAFLRYDPNSTTIIVSAEVNGLPAQMIVDTGASRRLRHSSLPERQALSHLVLKARSSPRQMAKPGYQGVEPIVSRSAGRGLVTYLCSSSLLIDLSVTASMVSLGLSFLGNFHMRIGGGTLKLRPLKLRLNVTVYSIAREKWT